MTEAMRNRDGTFVPSEETRRMISEKAQERYRQLEATLPTPRQGNKRCTACGEYKSYDVDDSIVSEFSMLTRHLKSGGTRKYPAGRCKGCAAKAKKAQRDTLDTEERRAAQREYMKKYKKKKKNQARRREYQREYETARRRKQGAPPRRFKRYEQPPSKKLNAEPLLRWIEPVDLARLNDEQRFALTKAAKSGHVTVNMADSIFLTLDAPHVMVILYGD